jgi:hypothetical protein
VEARSHKRMPKDDAIESIDATNSSDFPLENVIPANPLAQSASFTVPKAGTISAVTAAACALKPLASRLMHRRISRELSSDEACRPLPKHQMTYASLFGDRNPPKLFDFSVFVFEFFVQWLQPLSTPFLLLVQGRNAAENKGALPPRDSSVPMSTFLANTYYAVVGWLPQLLVACFKAKWAVTMVVVSSAYVFFRYLVIAGKYASYRRRDYLEVVLKQNVNIFDKILAAAWLDPTPETIDRELAEAQERFGVVWAGSALKLANDRCVPTKQYLRLLLHHAYGERSPTWFMVFFTCLRVCMAGYPVWVLMTYTNSPSVPDILITVTTAMQLFQNGAAVTLFLWVGYLSYRRQLAAMRTLLLAIVRSGVVPPAAVEFDSYAREIFSEEELQDPEIAIASETMFSLRIATNVCSFDKMRKIIRKMGYGYTQRISFNSFATAFVLGFLVLVLLQQALSSRPDWQLFTFVLVIFIASASITLACLFAAMSVNKVDMDFTDLFAHEEQYILEEYITEEHMDADANHVPSKALQQVHLLHDLICAVRRSIQQSQTTDPVRVMYMPARPELVSAFAGVLFSGLIIALQIGTDGGKRLNSE